MVEIHRWIGEGLFLIYVIVMAIVFFLGRRGRKAPSALVGVSHGLLAIQVAIGLIMFAEEPGRVVWYHPLLGLSAILALGLTPVFRKRMGATRGLVAGLGVVALLSLAAMLVVRT
jgi:energy-converting hydrogenase Eha subunit A